MKKSSVSQSSTPTSSNGGVPLPPPTGTITGGVSRGAGVSSPFKKGGGGRHNGGQEFTKKELDSVFGEYEREQRKRGYNNNNTNSNLPAPSALSQKKVYTANTEADRELIRTLRNKRAAAANNDPAHKLEGELPEEIVTATEEDSNVVSDVPDADYEILQLKTGKALSRAAGGDLALGATKTTPVSKTIGGGGNAPTQRNDDGKFMDAAEERELHFRSIPIRSQKFTARAETLVSAMLGDGSGEPDQTNENGSEKGTPSSPAEKTTSSTPFSATTATGPDTTSVHRDLSPGRTSNKPPTGGGAFNAMQGKSTAEDREKHEERIYLDYMKLQDQVDEYDDYRRQVGVDTFEGNFLGIQSLLAGNQFDNESLGDWDTFQKVEGMLKQFVFRKAPNDANDGDDDDTEQSNASKKFVEKLKEKLHRSREMVDDLKMKVRTLTNALTGTTKENKSYQVLIKEQGSELARMRSLNTTLLQQLRQMKTGRLGAAKRGSVVLASFETLKGGDGPSAKQQAVIDDLESQLNALRTDFVDIANANWKTENENRSLKLRVAMMTKSLHGGASPSATPSNGALQPNTESTDAFSSAVDALAALQKVPIDISREEYVASQQKAHTRAILTLNRGRHVWRRRLEQQQQDGMTACDSDANLPETMRKGEMKLISTREAALFQLAARQRGGASNLGPDLSSEGANRFRESVHLAVSRQRALGSQDAANTNGGGDTNAANADDDGNTDAPEMTPEDANNAIMAWARHMALNDKQSAAWSVLRQNILGDQMLSRAEILRREETHISKLRHKIAMLREEVAILASDRDYIAINYSRSEGEIRDLQDTLAQVHAKAEKLQRDVYTLEDAQNKVQSLTTRLALTSKETTVSIKEAQDALAASTSTRRPVGVAAGTSMSQCVNAQGNDDDGNSGDPTREELEALVVIFNHKLKALEDEVDIKNNEINRLYRMQEDGSGGGATGNHKIRSASFAPQASIMFGGDASADIPDGSKNSPPTSTISGQQQHSLPQQLEFIRDENKRLEKDLHGKEIVIMEYDLEVRRLKMKLQSSEDATFEERSVRTYNFSIGTAVRVVGVLRRRARGAKARVQARKDEQMRQEAIQRRLEEQDTLIEQYKLDLDDALKVNGLFDGRSKTDRDYARETEASKQTERALLKQIMVLCNNDLQRKDTKLAMERLLARDENERAAEASEKRNAAGGAAVVEEDTVDDGMMAMSYRDRSNRSRRKHTTQQSLVHAIPAKDESSWCAARKCWLKVILCREDAWKNAHTKEQRSQAQQRLVEAYEHFFNFEQMESGGGASGQEDDHPGMLWAAALKVVSFTGAPIAYGDEDEDGVAGTPDSPNFPTSSPQQKHSGTAANGSPDATVSSPLLPLVTARTEEQLESLISMKQKTREEVTREYAALKELVKTRATQLLELESKRDEVVGQMASSLALSTATHHASSVRGGGAGAAAATVNGESILNVVHYPTVVSESLAQAAAKYGVIDMVSLRELAHRHLLGPGGSWTQLPLTRLSYTQIESAKPAIPAMLNPSKSTRIPKNLSAALGVVGSTAQALMYTPLYTPAHLHALRLAYDGESDLCSLSTSPDDSIEFIIRHVVLPHETIDSVAATYSVPVGNVRYVGTTCPLVDSLEHGKDFVARSRPTKSTNNTEQGSGSEVMVDVSMVVAENGSIAVDEAANTSADGTDAAGEWAELALIQRRLLKMVRCVDVRVPSDFATKVLQAAHAESLGDSEVGSMAPIATPVYETSKGDFAPATSVLDTPFSTTTTTASASRPPPSFGTGAAFDGIIQLARSRQYTLIGPNLLLAAFVNPPTLSMSTMASVLNVPIEELVALNISLTASSASTTHHHHHPSSTHTKNAAVDAFNADDDDEDDESVALVKFPVSIAVPITGDNALQLVAIAEAALEAERIQSAMEEGRANVLSEEDPPYTLPELVVIHEVAVGDSLESVAPAYGMTCEYLSKYVDQKSFEVAMRAVQIPIVGSEILISLMLATPVGSNTNASKVGGSGPPVVAMLRSVQEVYKKLHANKESLSAMNGTSSSPYAVPTLSQAGVSESVAQWLRSPATSGMVRLAKPSGISQHPLVEPDCPTVRGVTGLTTWVAAYPPLPALVLHDTNTTTSTTPLHEVPTLQSSSSFRRAPTRSNRVVIPTYGSTKVFAVEVSDRCTLSDIVSSTPGLLREFTFIPNLRTSMRKSSIMSWAVRLRTPGQLRRVMTLGLEKMVYAIMSVDGMSIIELISTLNSSITGGGIGGEQQQQQHSQQKTQSNNNKNEADLNILTIQDIVSWNPELSSYYGWGGSHNNNNSTIAFPPVDAFGDPSNQGDGVVEGSFTAKYTGYLRVPVTFLHPEDCSISQPRLSRFLRLGGEFYTKVDADTTFVVDGEDDTLKPNTLHAVAHRLWCRSESDVRVFDGILDPFVTPLVIIAPQKPDGTKLWSNLSNTLLKGSSPTPSSSDLFNATPSPTTRSALSHSSSLPVAAAPWVIRFEYHSPSVVFPIRVAGRCAKIRSALERDIFDILNTTVPKRRIREVQQKLHQQQQKGAASSPTSPRSPKFTTSSTTTKPAATPSFPSSILGVSIVGVRPNNRAIVWVTVASFDDARIAIDMLSNEGKGCAIPRTNQAMTMSKTQEELYLGNITFHSLTNAVTSSSSIITPTTSTKPPKPTTSEAIRIKAESAAFNSGDRDSYVPGLVPLRCALEDCHVLFFKDHRRFVSTASNSGGVTFGDATSSSSASPVGTSYLTRLTLNTLSLETGVSRDTILTMNPDLAALLLSPFIVSSVDRCPSVISHAKSLTYNNGRSTIDVTEGATIYSIAVQLIEQGLVTGASSSMHHHTNVTSGPLSPVESHVQPFDPSLQSPPPMEGSQLFAAPTLSNALYSQSSSSFNTKGNTSDTMSVEEAHRSSVIQHLRFENRGILPLASLVAVLRTPPEAGIASRWMLNPSPSLSSSSLVTYPTDCRLARTIAGGSLLAVSMQFGVDVHTLLPSEINLVPGSCLKIPRHCGRVMVGQQALGATDTVTERIVLRGDTIATVAAEFGLSIRELSLCNASLVKVPAGSAILLPKHRAPPRHLSPFHRSIDGKPPSANSPAAVSNNFRQTYTGFLIRHVVGTNDTLTSICNRYNQSLLGVLAANPQMYSILGAHFLLVPLDDYQRDEALTMRCSSLFTIVATTAFDSLNSFSRQFGVSVNEILEATKLMAGHASSKDNNNTAESDNAAVNAMSASTSASTSSLHDAMKSSTNRIPTDGNSSPGGMGSSLSLNTLPLNKKIVIPLTSSQGRALAHRQHLNIYVGVELRPGESIVAIADRYNVYAKDVLVLGKRIQTLRVTHVDVPVSAELAIRFESERKLLEEKRKAPGGSTTSKDSIPKYRTVFQLGAVTGSSGGASGGGGESSSATGTAIDGDVQESRKREFLETLWGKTTPSGTPNTTSTPHSFTGLVQPSSKGRGGAAGVSVGSGGAVRVDNIDEEMVRRLQERERKQKDENTSLQAKVQQIVQNISQLTSRYEATQRELQSVEQVHASVVSQEGKLWDAKRQLQLQSGNVGSQRFSLDEEGRRLNENGNGPVLFAFNMECVATQTMDVTVLDDDYVSPIRIPKATTTMQTTLTSLEMDVIDETSTRSERTAQAAFEELAAYKKKVRHLFDEKSAIDKEFEQIRIENEQLKRQKRGIEGDLRRALGVEEPPENSTLGDGNHTATYDSATAEALAAALSSSDDALAKRTSSLAANRRHYQQLVHLGEDIFEVSTQTTVTMQNAGGVDAVLRLSESALLGESGNSAVAPPSLRKGKSQGKLSPKRGASFKKSSPVRNPSFAVGDGTSPKGGRSPHNSTGPTSRPSVSGPVAPQAVKPTKSTSRNTSRGTASAAAPGLSPFASSQNRKASFVSDTDGNVLSINDDGGTSRMAPTPPSSPPPTTGGRPTSSISTLLPTTTTTQQPPRSTHTLPGVTTEEPSSSISSIPAKRPDRVALIVASSAYAAGRCGSGISDDRSQHDSNGVKSNTELYGGSNGGGGGGIALPKLKTKIRKTAGDLSVTAKNIKSDLEELKRMTLKSFEDLHTYAKRRLLPLCSDHFTVEDLNLQIEELAIEREAEIDTRVVGAATAIASALGPHLTDLFTRVKRKKATTLRPFAKSDAGIFNTQDEDNLTQEEWVAGRLSNFIQGAVEDTLQRNREEAATEAARRYQMQLEDDEAYYNYADAHNTNPESIGLLLPRKQAGNLVPSSSSHGGGRGGGFLEDSMRRKLLTEEDRRILREEREALRRLKLKFAVDAEGKRRVHSNRDNLINAAAKGANRTPRSQHGGGPMVAQLPSDGVIPITNTSSLPPIHSTTTSRRRPQPRSSQAPESAFTKFAEATRTTSAFEEYGKHGDTTPTTATNKAPSSGLLEEPVNDMESHSDPYDDTALVSVGGGGDEDGGSFVADGNWRTSVGGNADLHDPSGRHMLRNRQGRRKSTVVVKSGVRGGDGSTDRWSPASIPQQVLQSVSKRRTTQTIINRVFLEMQGMLAAQLGNNEDPDHEAIGQITDQAVVSAAETARRKALSKMAGVKPEEIEALRKRDRELQKEGSKLMFRRVASQVRMRRLLDKLEDMEKEKSNDGIDRPPAHGANTSGQITQLWRGWLKSWSKRRKSVTEEREKNMQALAAMFALGNLKRSLSNVAQTTRTRATNIIIGGIHDGHDEDADGGSGGMSSPYKKAGSPLHRGNSMGKIMRVGSILPPAIPATKQPSSFHFSSVRFDAKSGATAAPSAVTPGSSYGGMLDKKTNNNIPNSTVNNTTVVVPSSSSNTTTTSPQRRNNNNNSTNDDDPASPLVAPKPSKPILQARPVVRKDSIIIKRHNSQKSMKSDDDGVDSDLLEGDGNDHTTNNNPLSFDE